MAGRQQAEKVLRRLKAVRANAAIVTMPDSFPRGWDLADPVPAGWTLGRIESLIDERLAASPAAPSLEELAALCNISVRQLTRGFRISRGCSIGEHIERRQMEAAKRLLVAGESVKAIAFMLGFSSPSSFAFAFRRAVSNTPSGFRQRQLRSLKG